jgi:diguanylate cyclase
MDSRDGHVGPVRRAQVPLSPRAALRLGLVAAMGACLAAYLGGLALESHLPHPLVDVWLSQLTDWVPVAVCWLAVYRVGFRRPEVLLTTVAMTMLAAGDTYYVGPPIGPASPSYPSLGDVGYLLFYALMLAALVAVVRRDGRGRGWSVWLDCAVGSLGAASVLAVLLSPVLASDMTGHMSLATAVSVAYPMFDLLLVAAVTGIVVLRGLRGSDRWSLLIAGLLVFATADVIYALQVNAGATAAGSPLNSAWAIGFFLIALYVNGARRRDGSASQEVSPATGATALVVSAAATAAVLGVLVRSSQVSLSRLAVVLAAATLLAAAARTQIAFHQLVRMADLRRQATTDHLTGLPNRRALYLQAGVRMAGPEPGRQALLLLDLDRFKEVNDSLGHHMGDQLLIQVGARLGEHLRDGDLLVRLGGDEFAVLLVHADHEQAAAVAVKLCAALAEPFTLEDIAVHTAASIGIALFPDDGPDLNTLLRKADVAMYKAKASADGHHVYGGADDTDFATKLRMVEELRTALTDGQLVVYYQPKIDLATGQVHDVEALVRWDHPTRGLLYPDRFLDLVEETGLMRAMTQVVLEIALDQAAAWHADGRQLTIAVNLSGSSLVDTDLPDQVAAMLAARDLPPSALQLEITEEFLMADRDRARDILTRLRSHGVQISIDDFGTGYSSLSYLRDLPVDELKLDKSFVFPMADDARAAALVASTIALAHSLGLRMVAEGVENDTAYTELAAMGCDQAQGYYMSRPVPAAQLEQWLSTRAVTDEVTGAPAPLSFAAPGQLTTSRSVVGAGIVGPPVS